MKYTNLKKVINYTTRDCMSTTEYQRLAYETPIVNKVFADLNDPKVKEAIKKAETRWERVKKTSSYKEEERKAKLKAEQDRLERQRNCMPFLIMNCQLNNDTL